MFLSKDDLKLAYGVNLEIGAHFVNRTVPKDNLYWRNRNIYVPGAPGYIFIPIVFDLLLRCGAEKQELMSEKQLQLQEAILHSAAKLEHKTIDWQTHIQEAIQAVAPHVSRKPFNDELIAYLNGPVPVRHPGSRFGTRFASLNRADSYLFLFSTLHSPGFDEDLAIQGWYALMTYFLILDDLADIKDDLKKGEENVLLDAGINETGIAIVTQMIEQSMQVMNTINPVMGNRIDHKKSVIDLAAIIRSITDA
jgi:hypothetical protein